MSGGGQRRRADCFDSGIYVWCTDEDVVDGNLDGYMRVRGR